MYALFNSLSRVVSGLPGTSFSFSFQFQLAPGVCGCGSADADLDGDGEVECTAEVKDCAGVAGGTNQIDMCGVCGAGDLSYLGCKEVETAGAATKVVQEVRRQSSNTIKLIRTHLSSRRLKRPAARMQKQTVAKRSKMVQMTAELPQKTIVCANSEFCLSRADSAVIEKLRAESREALRIARSVLRQRRADLSSGTCEDEDPAECRKAAAGRAELLRRGQILSRRFRRSVLRALKEVPAAAVSWCCGAEMTVIPAEM